ncbi:trans-cinnamate:CoA ligase, peroxisomal [Beta vulgaris subsp. vulgaris]|uniref:trans-cinnamate:CoA ligase, peroxisomal n=1 Tax=Beta vulgaris subsp. vulgaris TaxID=3555 RepID=UPI002036EC9D|nr:trans-cinnamate:CoA ligase, peroxisomal [Beta vulgaris subsp. vulgaris]
MDKLSKCDANYAALTPITFLKRAAMCYADRASIIYGQSRFTWSETYDRCRRLASSLHSQLRLSKNDVVSVLAPNIPAVYEMHFAVPMAGCVLNTINSMLDAKTIKTILCHSEAKILFVDYEYISLACQALRLLKTEEKPSFLPSIILINEIGFPMENNGGDIRQGELKYEQLLMTSNGDLVTESSLPLVDVDLPLSFNLERRHNVLEYEQLIAIGNPNFMPVKLDDEWDPIALNYTSGTTSAPKGVVYSHRGAYLSTLSMVLGWEMGTEPVYLWSLPMFHCNGWTFTWGVAARGGTNVCIRKTTASEIYRSIALHGVTHMCCAPIVFNIIREAKPHERVQIKSHVQILTGGAPPPAALLLEMKELGFHVMHAYGLTEATGPALVCEWQNQWEALPNDDQARLKARQGVGVLSMADVDVMDMKTKQSVPRNGKSKGEIVLRGSGIMKGYLKNEEETSKAFKDGWFHTGDVGVIHPNGYVEIKDRLKDVIISGGENISSVEVETVIFRHPKVLDAAVVAMPHPRWGESPCAFVVKKVKNENLTEQEILVHCRSNLPHYMVPKKVVFLEVIPKTATGKPKKDILRDEAKKSNALTLKNDHQIDQTITLSRL